MFLTWYKVSIVLSAWGLLKPSHGNEWTEKWVISNVSDVCLTQSTRFKKWHMNVLVSCIMLSVVLKHLS